MTRPATRTIPSAGDADHPGRGRPIPTREQLNNQTVELLRQGGPAKADLWIVDRGHGPVVVKDFARKAGWVRWIGRFQIGRECRAYRGLGPMRGIPRFLGRIDAHALALEHIEGQPLFRAPERHERAGEFLRQIREIMTRMHARGVVHLDLRGKDNVLLGHDGNLVLLDLASALVLRPKSLRHRWLYQRLKMTDETALLKWKLRLGGGPFTAQERKLLNRHRVWRRLWVFNTKRRPTNRESSE